jgi:hypothetical protein
MPSTIQSLDVQLWNRAYNDLKREEPGLVDAYERLLSHEFWGDSGSRDLTAQENEIEQEDLKKRQDQMSRLVAAGLKKIEREARVKDTIEEGMQLASSAKEVVDIVLKAYPEAGLAWAGVCCALQVSLAKV